MPAFKRKRNGGFSSGTKRHRQKAVTNWKRKVETVAKRAIAKANETLHYSLHLNNSVSSTETVLSLTAPPQGDSAGSRSGDSIIPKSIKIMYQVRGNTNDTYNNVRLVIFRYDDDTFPTIGNLFDTSIGYSSVTHPYKTTDVKFKVVYDRIHTVRLTQSDVAGVHVDSVYGVSNVYRQKIKLSSKRITFQPGTVTGTSKYYLLLVSDSSAPAHPDVTGFIRFFYQDP